MEAQGKKKKQVRNCHEKVGEDWNFWKLFTVLHLHAVCAPTLRHTNSTNKQISTNTSKTVT